MNLELCRLCGKDSGLTCVFEENDLWLKIFMCFGVKVERDDGITQQVCKSCYFFTNSVYEFRLNSIAHDTKLKSIYEESHLIDVKPAIISYPSEISQDDFLNTFNLANKNETYLKKSVYHPSVIKVKRKFPNINLPEECYQLHIDPVVPVEVPPKLMKLNQDNLGIWSISGRQLRGKDLILTRVRSDQVSENDADNESDTVKYETVVSPVSPRTNTVRKKKNGTCPWTTTHRKKRKSKLQKVDLAKTIQKKTILPKSIISEPSPIVSTNNDLERNALNLLIESDTQLNDTAPLPEDSYSNAGEVSPPRPGEYSNLLIAVGEEIPTFICQTCNKVFDTEDALADHKKSTHKSSLRCTKCSKRFGIVESLVNHTLTCHPETVFNETELIFDDSDTVFNELETVNAQTNEPNLVIATAPSVAKKKTSATVPEEKRQDLQEFIISSDDDVEITDIIERSENENSNSATDDVEPIEHTDLGSEKSLTNEEPKQNETPILSLMLQKPKKNSLELEKENIVATTEDIMLIDDSDDETEKTKISTASKENIKSVNDHSKSPLKKNTKPTKKYTNIAPKPQNTISNKENTKTSVGSVPDKEESFVIDDDSETESILLIDRQKNKSKSKRSSESSSSAPSNSTDIDNSYRQQIVVVPSAEDKEHMDACSSVKAKITNELNYVNYIFNKCSYVDKPKNDKKWFLKDVDKFTEKTYLPVELIRTTGEEVIVEYGQTIIEKPVERLAFWDTDNAIDFSKRVPKSPKNTKQSFETVFKEYAKRLSDDKKNDNKKYPLRNKGSPKVIKTLVPPNVTEIEVNPTMFIIENPKASTTGLAQIVSNASTISRSTSTVSPSILRSTNTVPNISNIQVGNTVPSSILRSTNALPHISNIHVVSTAPSTVARPANATPQISNIQVVSTAPSIVSRPANTISYISNIQVATTAPSTVSSIPANAVPRTSNIQVASSSTVSRPVNAVSHISNNQVASSAPSAVSRPANIVPHNSKIQVVSTASSTVARPTHHREGNTAMPIARVASVSQTPASNYQVVNAASSTITRPTNIASNQVFPRIENPTHYHPHATKKLLNFALQKSVHNFNRNPPFVSFLSKNNSQDDYVEIAPVQSNGYILMGVATQNGMIQPGSENTVFLRELDDSSGSFQINKPIILNGMSYPAVAKIRNPNQTLVVQQLTQPRNVNIQNCFNINQQDMTSDPIIITESSNSPQPSLPAILPLLPPAEITPLPNQDSSQATPSISKSIFESTSDSTVSTTRPIIRIKNLSELTGETPNINVRDELHNMYSNTLTTYVQNHSSTLTNRANNDEYLQIS